MKKFNERSRYVKRLHSRVMRKRRFQLVIMTVIISAILVFVSITAFHALKKFHLPKINFSKKEVIKKKDLPKSTFALIGVDQREYEQFVSGISVFVYDPNDGKLSALSFNKDIRLQIPGYGLDVLEKSLFAGNEAALYTITNIVGVKVSKYIMIDAQDYSTSKKVIKKLKDSVLETNYSKREQDKIVSNIKKVKEEDINILETPTRLVAIANKPYKQLKKNEVNRLVKILWDEKYTKRPKAIVLNGVGTSGLAGKMAMKLIDQGFEVIDIKNANSFNYKNTLIVIYSQKLQKKALSVQKMLGYGSIMLELDKQGLTDLTVIIGRNKK